MKKESFDSPKTAVSAASLEWKLLLATTAAPTESTLSRLSSLLEAKQRQSVNWQVALSLAEAHGTSAFLFQNLAQAEDMVPSPVLESMRQRYQTNVQKSLVLAREVSRILEVADSLDIELIAYKGLVLSEAYYGDIALRQAGDIDLFVRKRDALRIRNALGELGYAPRLHIPGNTEQNYLESGYEYSFDSPLGKSLLELQWNLQPRYYAVDYDMDGLFARAVDATLAGRRVLIPSPEDLLLVLSVHAAKHVWGRLIWLRDIAQILNRGNLNWNFILSDASELGIVRILYLTFLLANRFLEMPIPPEIEVAIVNDHVSRAFADEIAPSITAGVSWEEKKISYFHLMMRLRERRIDRVRFLARLTFTPGPGEWKALELPRTLFPLYRVVRLARLASKFASR